MQSRNGVLADRDACGVGFIAQLGSPGSHEVIQRALTALVRLSHRGGIDADGQSGDGAGLLTAIPQGFIREGARQAGISLPVQFGLGMLFLQPELEAESCLKIAALAPMHGLRCLGWRTVPVHPAIAGPRALATMPVIKQCFLAAHPESDDLERALFLLRKRLEAELGPAVYFCSLSSRTVIYKGLLTPLQLPAFYPDLRDEEFKSPFAVFHQRYSTNTRPSWSLAQPFRFVGHNGEINTIGANRRWQRARAAGLRRRLGVEDSFPALMEEGVSDSASFDNVLEILLRQSHSPAAAMLQMAPPAWESDDRMGMKLRRYLAASAATQEPWDGPAALAFSDGLVVGAKLDRNGLRPLRYTLTADGLLVLGSETGLADLEDKTVIERQRLGPGEILLVDIAAGALFRNRDVPVPAPDREGRKSLPRRLPASPATTPPTPDRWRVAASLGWSEDQYRLLFQPLELQGQEAVWSMGDDAPPAFLSTARRPLWEHCKQRFAQVTNPPIDSLREKHVMSLELWLGNSVVMGSPVIDGGQLAAISGDRMQPWPRVDLTFDAGQGLPGAMAALQRVRREAAKFCGADANRGGLLLSDRGVATGRAALPALLAVAAAGKCLRDKDAGEVPIIIETGQVIDTHHVALLVAAGASAVFPYLAFDLAEELHPGSLVNLRGALEAGLRKVIARLGISTLASYRNSQLFEIVGLDQDVCAEFFEDAPCILGGKGLADLLQDALHRHQEAFAPAAGMRDGGLRDAGLYRFRRDGERHSSSPELVRHLHRYIKSPTPENYQAYTGLALHRETLAVRDLLETIPCSPAPLPEVEPEDAILRRFSTQAMSLGAISPEAHRTLAIAMNRLGGRSNTGEGGEDLEMVRLHPEAENQVKQVSSGRFGVTAEYLARASELEIKMAQGSKPGEGGQLPAIKVNAYIAGLRHAVPGTALISPPPHHDIYSIEDLAQLIHDLRAINPTARIGVKLVASAGVGIIAAGVAKAGAQVITISGFDGGTGASPLTSIKNTGIPWEVGLREAHCALLQAGFRGSVRLRVDGGFKLGRDVVIAALLGADEFGFGTAALLAMGCVMARQCHLNTCPVGIATQDDGLRSRFTGKPEMVISFFRAMAAEVRERLAALGARSLDEIIGAVQLLRPRDLKAARGLQGLLHGAPPVPLPLPNGGRENEKAGEILPPPGFTIDLATRRRVLAIANCDRSVGARLSGEILRRTGYAGLGGKSMQRNFRGVAGQSFGAFLISGVEFHLAGEANDYVGKGLSGGKIAITAGPKASRRGDVLAGNTVLYGATSGELYIAGAAGERFAVRNSGALAVVEGIGQHGCEYMTAGVAIILGPWGANFGSGMTGGLAYILPSRRPKRGLNQDCVGLAPVEEPAEMEWLRCILREHLRLTGSPRAARLLSSGMPLPLMRVEPLAPPCSPSQTWAPVLARFNRTDYAIPGREEVFSETPVAV